MILWKIQESNLKIVQKNVVQKTWRFESCLTSNHNVCFGFPSTKVISQGHLWPQILFWQLSFPFSLCWLVLLLSKVIFKVFFLENCSAEIAPAKKILSLFRSVQDEVQKPFLCVLECILCLSHKMKFKEKIHPQNFNICTFYVCYQKACQVNISTIYLTRVWSARCWTPPFYC